MGKVIVAVAALGAWLALLGFCALGPVAGGTWGLLGTAVSPLGMALTAFALFGGKDDRRDGASLYRTAETHEDSHILGSGRPRRRL